MNSSTLYVVKNNPQRKATKEEMEYAKTKSVFDKQTDASNELLEKARELNGCDIQTFEQIVEYLIETHNSFFDIKNCELFITSDYYKLLEINCQNNPKYYDIFNTIYDTPERIAKSDKFIK